MMKRLILLPCLLLLTLFLAACDASTSTSSLDNGSANTPTSSAQLPTLPAIMATGKFHEYTLPLTDSQVMRPAMDSLGRLWFGEMGHNYLAVFDSRTHTFRQITPPHGQSGIMGLAVASDNTVWFAEQYANYIGHYFPTDGQFQMYNLPTFTIPDPTDATKTLTLPSAPNEIAFDAHGTLWFTEMNADALGSLDTHTGRIQHYPISEKKTVQTLNPYGVTVDAQGRVWFTEAVNNTVGCYDPATGHFRFFTMQGVAHAPFMEIASDTHGTLWITSFSSGLLTNLDPLTATFTPYYAPHTGSTGGGLYGLAVTRSGEVWVTVTAENAIARLDVATHQFVYYAIPTSGSLPIGLAMGANHTLWFTEVNKIGMLES